MTQEETQFIIKRYTFIDRAITVGDEELNFYVGNRKNGITITEEVKTTYAIIREVFDAETNFWIKYMIRRILRGDSDVSIMRSMPVMKNAYYARKQRFECKVLMCCIAKGLVDYSCILSMPID